MPKKFLITDWLWADYLLYDHFKNKFMRERDTYGVKKLEHEKDILKRATDKVKERCIDGKVDNNLLSKKDRLYGRDVMGYRVKEGSGEDCPYYTMKEANFVEEVRAIQQKKSIKKLKELGRPSLKDSSIDSKPLSNDAVWASPKELNIEELKKRFKYKEPM